MKEELFNWLSGSHVPEHEGNPIADALKSGRNTEFAYGEIEDYDDHPVIVKKYWKKDGDESRWVVYVEVPNGPQDRTVRTYHQNQFVADAVFEKLVRDYDLEEGTPPEDYYE